MHVTFLLHDEDPDWPPLLEEEDAPSFLESSPPLRYLFPTLLELMCELFPTLLGVFLAVLLLFLVDGVRLDE